MNWFVNGPVNGKIDSGADLCEHVTADATKAVYETKELDSFGTVGIYVMCGECTEEHHRKEAEEKHWCGTCDKEYPASEINFYRFPGFDAASGDEESKVCDICYQGGKWSAIRKEDQEERDHWESHNE